MSYSIDDMIDKIRNTSNHMTQHTGDPETGGTRAGARASETQASGTRASSFSDSVFGLAVKVVMCIVYRCLCRLEALLFRVA